MGEIMKRFSPVLLTALGLVLGSQSFAYAADNETDATSDDGDYEEVFVTGTYIPRITGKSSSPAAIVDSESISAQGANTVADLTQNLTINTGAQNYTDAFTQNISTGTSNINLRGLGLASTLVLLNGKRQVVSGVPSDNGLLFVDTSSLVPLNAIGRIEILKDGSAALYGSDAVAGVVNFITRDGFEGIELSGRAQAITDDSQLDLNVGGLFGIGNDQTNLMVAVEYLNRSSLTTAERRFPGSMDPINGDFSNAGNPGSFIVPFLPTGLSGALQAAWTGLFDSAGIIPGIADYFEPLLGAPSVAGALPPLFTDFNCAAGDNSVVPSTYPFGYCRLDFGDYYDLVSEEERLLGYLKLTHEFGNGTNFMLEMSGAMNSAKRNNSPSFPIPSAQGMAANNPFSPYGPSPEVAPDTYLPIFFIGRAVGNGPPAVTTHDNDTWRIHARFDGEWGDNGTWEVSFTHAENKFKFTANDILADRFSLALNGLGGASCSGGIPGLNGCQYFNPFGTALLASPGDTVPGPYGGDIPLVNDPALIDWFTGLFTQDYDSKLTVGEAIMTNQIDGILPNPISYAFGFQYRASSYSLNMDAQANADNYLFIIGGPDFTSNQDVYAFFGELDVPLHERVDLQLALRYEKYDNGVGDTLDPKVGIYVEASDTFSLRGSFGTSFRAPTGFQLFGTQTSVQQLIDTLPGSSGTPQFYAVRTVGGGTGSLTPEDGKNFNAGFTWAPNDRFKFDFDYWWYDFSNIIVRESAQAILDANPVDPRIVRDPTTGSIEIIMTSFVNASQLKTSGFDFDAQYLIPLDDMGDLTLGFTGTHISNYDLIDPQAGMVSGEGSRNFRNFGTSTPQWRFIGSAHWDIGQHDIFVYVRYIDSYTDDQNNLPIKSHTTVDFQYNLTIGDKGDEKAWRLQVGVINIFNNYPPTVLTNQGFDTKVHDPRGRMVYGAFVKGF